MTIKEKYDFVVKKIQKATGKKLIPCDCPKGGLIGEEERVCPKCNGVEWRHQDYSLADILAVIEKRDIEDYKKGSFWLEMSEQYNVFHDSLSWHAKNRPELIEWLYEILK